MKNNGYFPFPNMAIDRLLCLLSGAQFKILSLIMRQTLGWRKHWDRISIGQFGKKCGLSRQGVLDSLPILLDNKLILRDKVNEAGSLPQNWYALFGETNEADRLVKSVDQYDELTSQVILHELINSVDQLGDKLVNSVDPQKKGSKNNIKTTNIKKKDISNIVTKQEGVETEEVVVVSGLDLDQEEPPVLTIKSDTRIIVGAILKKYRTQIMDRPPSPNALRDALESYTVDQLGEAIERMPIVLKPTDPTTVIDGNYALSLACGAVKNPHWWRRDDGDNGKGTEFSPTVETREETIRSWLEYCSRFPNRQDDIYLTLVDLSKETGRPVEELYAESEFLRNPLDYYKDVAKEEACPTGRE